MLDFLIILVHTTISADGPFSQSRSHIVHVYIYPEILMVIKLVILTQTGLYKILVRGILRKNCGGFLIWQFHLRVHVRSQNHQIYM